MCSSCAVMGPSGSGKSTLLSLAGGLATPTAGDVIVEGTALGDLDPRLLAQLRRRAVGYVFQDFNLIPALTAVIGDRRLVLADEPTGALDSDTGEAVLRLLRRRVDAGAAAVLVTHEARSAAWADRILFLRDGSAVDEAEAPAAESLLGPAS